MVTINIVVHMVNPSMHGYNVNRALHMQHLFLYFMISFFCSNEYIPMQHAYNWFRELENVKQQQ